MIYDSENYVVLDFETTAYNHGLALFPENRLVLACWKVGPHGKINVLWGNEFEMASLVEAVSNADFLVAHNAKFELQWLKRCGMNTEELVVWDTMIAEHILAGNRNFSLSLDESAKRRLGKRKKLTVGSLIELGIPVETIPDLWLVDYCSRDVELTVQTFLVQIECLRNQQQMHLIYARCLLTPILSEMEWRGLQLDPERVLPELATKEARYNELGAVLSLALAGRNPNSPLQLAEFLYDQLAFEEPKKKGPDNKWAPDRTATGRRKTNADTVARLRATTPQQKEFLNVYTEHRELHGELTKYLRKFGDCCATGGLLRAQFNQCRTQTHRLSSNGLEYSTQLQNLPRNFKRLFKARTPGWLIGEVDGSQLEFRVAAHLGRDEQAVKDIVHGVDVHKETARIIGVSRQDAKTFTFKPLYGGTSGTEAQKEYFAYFKNRYKGITDTQRQWVSAVLENKELRTEYGMIFYWPDTTVKKSGYVTNTTAICNFPVQGFATAEIIPLSVIALNRLIKATGAKMFIVNTVHDSIVVELPPDEIELFHQLARQALIEETYRLLEDIYGINLVVPLGCGVKVGEHWGEGTEVKYEAEPYLYTKEKADE